MMPPPFSLFFSDTDFVLSGKLGASYIGCYQEPNNPHPKWVSVPSWSDHLPLVACVGMKYLALLSSIH